MALTLAQLAEELGAQLHGPGDIELTGVGTLRSAGPGELSFLANPRYRAYLEATRAGAVLCTPDEVENCPVPALAVANPYLAYARASRHFDRTPAAEPGIHPSAVVHETARVHETASIGPNVVIEAGARIGAHAVLMANVYVGRDAVLGEHVRLWPGVVIYHEVSIGNRSVVHANTVIGSDGFGFAPSREGWVKVAQTGSVRIGDDVDIGASTTIDRGAIEDTVIGNGAIIDNQVMIAHNVVIGEHTAIAGTTGIAGSTRIGRNCVFAGAVGVAGHLEICDNVQVLGMSLVSRSLTKPGVYGSGLPVEDERNWRRNAVRLRQLDDLFRRVKALEKQAQGQD